MNRLEMEMQETLQEDLATRAVRIEEPREWWEVGMTEGEDVAASVRSYRCLNSGRLNMVSTFLKQKPSRLTKSRGLA